ncbi:MAG: tandem-95 repeat protein [Rhodoferax sp.]|nr:tandem-95 repeat protein [Rhodoferax sp.]
MYTYTPNANYNGADSFTYTITDADGDVSTATVSFNVGSVDDLPLAVNDSPLGITEDTPFSGTLAGNDTPSGDGGNLWSLATAAANGTAVVNADGTYTYTPNANFTGSDSFTYTITDADGDASTATVSSAWPSMTPRPDSPGLGTALRHLAATTRPGHGGNVWAGPAGHGTGWSARHLPTPRTPTSPARQLHLHHHRRRRRPSTATVSSSGPRR